MLKNEKRSGVKTIIVCLALLMLGCDNRTYKGKPVSEWVQLCNDADFVTAFRAKQEIMHSYNIPEFDRIAEKEYASNMLDNKLLALRNPACADKHRHELPAEIEKTKAAGWLDPAHLTRQCVHLDKETLKVAWPTLKKYCKPEDLTTLEFILQSP